MTTEPMVPSLRSVIDAGGSPLALMHGDDDYPIEKLGDMLCNAIGCSSMRDSLLEEAQLHIALWKADADHVDIDRLLLEEAWEIELLSNPAMVDEVLATVADAFDLARLSVRVDCARAPHPIEVELNDGSWMCDGCGACFDGSGSVPQIWPGGREGFSEEPDAEGYVPAWCLACVEAALERAKALSR